MTPSSHFENKTIGYISTRGGIDPVEFDTALLQGFARDGGLFVPDQIPEFSREELAGWKGLSFTDLAHKILRPFIPSHLIPDADLARILEHSFSTFSHAHVLPVKNIAPGDKLYVMELFHGPTLSFKDIAMGFLVRVMDYFLAQRGETLSLILATTGDTGPAAAHAAVGCKTLDCYPLFPLGMISQEQQRQMTTLGADNVMAVGVTGCKDGGDDLDLVVTQLFADPQLRDRLRLSSVNSVNWCRVMFQSIHYIYGYLNTVERVGDPLAVSVPCGAFGNLFGGWLAREMGLPIHQFICAVNANQTLYRAFNDGIFTKADLIPTVSSAIDIVVPYNFWRFLYFNCGRDGKKLAGWMDEFQTRGRVALDRETREAITRGFVAESVSDAETLATMAGLYGDHGYLADPHAAVALTAARRQRKHIPARIPILTMATAHPAKFSEIISRGLKKEANDLPPVATHPELERAKALPEELDPCHLDQLAHHLITQISSRLTGKG
ncbi:MAG: threonine synthase [Desulfobacterales bacterium]|nr:threonine synthase [Desulfobacterales bacterium]